MAYELTDLRLHHVRQLQTSFLVQMEELKSSALSFIAQNFAAVANLSHDLAGLADSLLSRLAKVWHIG